MSNQRQDFYRLKDNVETSNDGPLTQAWEAWSQAFGPSEPLLFQGKDADQMLSKAIDSGPGQLSRVFQDLIDLYPQKADMLAETAKGHTFEQFFTEDFPQFVATMTAEGYNFFLDEQGNFKPQFLQSLEAALKKNGLSQSAEEYFKQVLKVSPDQPIPPEKLNQLKAAFISAYVKAYSQQCLVTLSTLDENNLAASPYAKFTAPTQRNVVENLFVSQKEPYKSNKIDMFLNPDFPLGQKFVLAYDAAQTKELSYENFNFAKAQSLAYKANAQDKNLFQKTEQLFAAFNHRIVEKISDISNKAVVEKDVQNIFSLIYLMGEKTGKKPYVSPQAVVTLETIKQSEIFNQLDQKLQRKINGYLAVNLLQQEKATLETMVSAEHQAKVELTVGNGPSPNNVSADFAVKTHKEALKEFLFGVKDDPSILAEVLPEMGKFYHELIELKKTLSSDNVQFINQHLTDLKEVLNTVMQPPLKRLMTCLDSAIDALNKEEIELPAKIKQEVADTHQDLSESKDDVSPVTVNRIAKRAAQLIEAAENYVVPPLNEGNKMTTSQSLVKHVDSFCKLLGKEGGAMSSKLLSPVATIEKIVNDKVKAINTVVDRKNNQLQALQQESAKTMSEYTFPSKK